MAKKNDLEYIKNGHDILKKNGIINVKLTRWDNYLGGGYAIQYEFSSFPNSIQNTFEKGDINTAFKKFVEKVEKGFID